MGIFILEVEMKTDIQELQEAYFKIKEKGWIKSMRKGPGGIGYTFETLLNREENNLPIPDFNSIEIKTMRKNSRRVLHLFNLTPDGDFLFPIKRIIDKIGYPNKNNRNYKVLKADVNAIKYTYLGCNKRIKLYVNHLEEKIELITEDGNGKKININISWSFLLLKKTLELKLGYLALIKADNKFMDNEEYFCYNEIQFYKLISFDKFLWLIEYGVISITFNIDVFKSGKRIGQIHDHGTNFSIKTGYLCNLYKKIIL